MTLTDAKKTLKAAISELEDSFWSVEDVHDIEVRIDAVRSAIEDFNGTELEDPIASTTDKAAEATENLVEYSHASSYGESLLDNDDLIEANSNLETLHGELEKWFNEQLETN